MMSLKWKTSGLRFALSLALCAAVSSTTVAFAAPQKTEDKTKAKTKTKTKKGAADDPFGDLFGAPAATPTDLDALKAATSSLEKGGLKKGLKPKAATIRDGVKVEFSKIFAAERIRLDRKKGCIPSTKRTVRIKEFQFSQLPAQSPPFSVCVRMASDVGRLMRMSVTFVDPRMKRIAHADGVADFTGKDELDHILDWPSLWFSVPGVYSYVVDLDGKRVEKIPVFEVKVNENVEE